MKKYIAATAAALIATLAISGCSAPSAGSDPAVPAPTQSETTAEETRPAEEPTATETESTPPEPEIKYYDNGDHIVGTDIKPDVYRAEVEDSIIPLCTVSQTTEAGKIMDIRNANEGSVIFTVVKKKGSVASFSGCTNIARAKDVLRKDAEPGNGYFLVGDELAPGKYSGTVDTEGAIALGTVAQYNAKGKVMDIRNANDGKVVFTVKKSKGSVVSFSGFSKVKKVN